jgi:hypothetical protein
MNGSLVIYHGWSLLSSVKEEAIYAKKYVINHVFFACKRANQMEFASTTHAMKNKAKPSKKGEFAFIFVFARELNRAQA